ATAGQAHVIELTTDNSRYQFYHKSMKQIMDSLGDPFVKLSQSEIVNIDKVKSYHPIEKTLTVQNGDKLTIAQRLYGKISRALKARNIPTEKD
ncbi:MAG: LytTR family transcriptional regulator, partial [Abiotrophia defectiva]|nr:LytTR family transcriptional regulator [Abiotrophia defectiva]